MAETLHWRFYGETLPQQQLLDYLQDKQMLLLFDNFEHLLEAAPFIANILKAAPGIHLLITSRQSLRLQEEWFHPINGLSYPAENIEPTAPTDFAAVRLFVQHARRARSSFSLDNELPDVLRICQLVEGMPLALELAAAWLRSLTCQHIVQEIEQSLDILMARHQNMPARHHSMSAVLEQS